MIWGWIPSISDCDPVRDIIPLPPNGVNFEDGTCIINTESGYAVITDDGKRTDVSIVLGLVSFDGSDKLASSEWPSTEEANGTLPYFRNQYVYEVVKGLYHSDVTHGHGSGLQCVETNDFRQALLAILEQFMIVDEWRDVEKRYDEPPPRAKTMVRSIGLMKYGLSFLDAYSEYIPKYILKKHREYLCSNLEFLDDMSHYIHDDYSGRMEKSNHMLNRSVAWMTHVVIALTWTSVVFGSYSALEATGLFDEIDTWWVIVFAVVPSVSYLVYMRHAIRKKFTRRNDREERAVIDDPPKRFLFRFPALFTRRSSEHR